MERTNEAHPSNLTTDGRDADFLRQQERARAFQAARDRSREALDSAI